MWLVGGINGYAMVTMYTRGLMGVVVRRYIDILTIFITFPYSMHLY